MTATYNFHNYTPRPGTTLVIPAGTHYAYAETGDGDPLVAVVVDDPHTDPYANAYCLLLTPQQTRDIATMMLIMLDHAELARTEKERNQENNHDD